MEEFLQFRKVYNKDQEKIIKEEFSRLEGQCYLEHAGSSLYSEKQIENVFNELKHNVYGNPHSLSVSSKLSEDTVDQIRFRVLEHFNASSEEYSVIFTSGTTGGLKLVGEQFNYAGNTPDENKEYGTFTYPQDNHTSVLGMREYAKNIEIIEFHSLINIFKNEKYSTNGIHNNGKQNGEGIDEESYTNSLFIYPAQCNFAGTKYPLSWIDRVHNGILNDHIPKRKTKTKWYCMVDAASYVSTNKIDLSVHKPDFVAFSFYKIFGYPTGLGALLIKNESADVLKKIYFGGGTVQIALSTIKFHVLRNDLHERLEDGTIPFLAIAALKHGFDTLSRIGITMDQISEHVFQLGRYIHHNLLTMHHSNGNPVAQLYTDSDFENRHIQGGILNLNFKRDNGDFVSFTEALHYANLYNIHIRTGCFCNPGACQRHLKLTNSDCQKHFEAGHICGDQHHVVDGVPTGAVRLSFGYMTTKKDMDTFLEMIRECFVTKPVVVKYPDDWDQIKSSFIMNHLKEQTCTKPKTEVHNIKTQNISQCPVSFVKSKNEVNNSRNENDDNGYDGKELELKKVFIYPIKSCGYYSINGKWDIINTGLRYDRHWMITNSNGVCLTQKHEPKMCLIKPYINLEEGVMQLTYPDIPSINIPLNLNYVNKKEVNLCQSKICRDSVSGIDCGDDVMHWLESALGKPGLRIVQQNDHNGRIRRNKNESENVELSLSNEAQFLLINTRSIEWLAKCITDPDIKITIPNLCKRFRANFIIKGSEEFEEHNYKHIKIGDTVFECIGPCTRCQMICIDQMTGEKTKEPLRTLAANSNGKLQFGLYLKPVNEKSTTVITVGQAIKFYN